ncbi:MAG: MFS transporter [Bacteroidota bacterium]
MPERPPLSVKIIYALGQLGWSLTSFGAANLLIYFYFPPEVGEGAGIFPTYVYQGALFGIIAVLGLITSGGRLFDAVTDPLIASWTDRNQSRLGKRRIFLAGAAFPFALFSVLIFYPISTDTSTNTWWLIFTIFVFFLFMTLYTVPYTALISELGHHESDRMLLSTLLSVTWALGFLIGNSAYAIQGMLESSYSATEAFQIAIAAFALIGLLFMLVPVFFLDERRYARQKVTEISAFSSLGKVFGNRNFRFFSFSDLLYWIALTFIQLGVSFYITILLGMDKSFATLFMTIGFFASFLLYAPINWLVRRWGKRRVLLSAFVVFSAVFGLTYGVAWLPLPKLFFFYALALLSAFPLAAFGIIPNAIVADIVYQHERQSGEQLAGMFYGARNFMMKMGITLANLIFPSLLLWGKSADNPTGVQLSALAAVLFCLAGYALFRSYRETPAASAA